MNYSGSYTRLMRNAVGAMRAAIEIYNKPAFEYRTETCCVLLFNAWELLLKAIMSKNGQSIYEKKVRGKPYKTITWGEAFGGANKFFPKSVSARETSQNLELLSTYRNNTIHFYNEPDFSSVIHALAQTSIMNFSDLLKLIFAVDLGSELDMALLPLGNSPPIDAITYMSQAKPGKTRPAVRQFLAELAKATKDIIDSGGNLARLLTVYKVKLESVKTIQKADLVVGVAGADTGTGPLVIERRIDPNKSHPLRRKDVLKELKEKHQSKVGPYQFDAIVRVRGLMGNDQYCWKADEGGLVKYSHDTVAFIAKLSDGDVAQAVSDYKNQHNTTKKPA
jgi:hypothetical protein